MALDRWRLAERSVSIRVGPTVLRERIGDDRDRVDAERWFSRDGALCGRRASSSVRSVGFAAFDRSASRCGLPVTR